MNGLYRPSNSLCNQQQRIHQYTGGHNESWGGVTLNIDSDVIDNLVPPPFGKSSICCSFCIRMMPRPNPEIDGFFLKQFAIDMAYGYGKARHRVEP